MLKKWAIYLISVFAVLFLYYHFSPPGTALFQGSDEQTLIDVCKLLFICAFACPFAAIPQKALFGILFGASVGLLSLFLAPLIDSVLSLFSGWMVAYFMVFFLVRLIKKSVKHQEQPQVT